MFQVRVPQRTVLRVKMIWLLYNVAFESIDSSILTNFFSNDSKNHPSDDTWSHKKIGLHPPTRPVNKEFNPRARPNSSTNKCLAIITNAITPPTGDVSGHATIRRQRFQTKKTYGGRRRGNNKLANRRPPDLDARHQIKNPPCE
ncbi:hypothetical protein YC2023_024061 [Brassica napus]